MPLLTRSIALLTLVGMATFASSAPANMISFSHTTSQAVTPFTDNFTLSGFNPALGTLTGISITVTSTISGEVDIQNNSSTDYGFTNAFASVPITLINPDGTKTTLTASAVVASGTALANTVTKFTNPTDQAVSSTTNVATSQFASYYGSASLSFSAGFAGASYGGTTNPGTPGSTLFFGGSSLAGGTTTITYSYTPAAVPEPASLALVAAGLGGVGLVTRRPRRA